MSWTPAVPPPPVAGAAVGTGLGVADGWDVADALGAADRLAEGLALALGVFAFAVWLGELVGVAEPLTAGENGVGIDEGVDPEQAETDAEASMAKVAQPAAVNFVLSLVPVMVMRILYGTSSCIRQLAGPFPGRGSWREDRGPARSLPAPPTAGFRRAGGHKGKGRGRHSIKWPIHHWNIRLRD